MRDNSQTISMRSLLKVSLVRTRYMIKDGAKKTIDVVIVWKLDDSFITVKAALMEKDVKVLSVRGVLDTMADKLLELINQENTMILAL
ncbi:MAG: hypothetical protein IJD97_05605 [Clostridia bacterium]|nr:hypothetical protein [Clostridia bacterium]